MVKKILRKQQDNFLVAYHRFLQEVKIELAQLQKEYSAEVLKKQSDEQMKALKRSLEWFKDECLKLSNDVKNKAKIIENLRFKNEELMTYKKGYETGIKEIKRDMLVLKFINKTKTKLLRKYTLRLKKAKQIYDNTDLRKPIELYLSSNPLLNVSGEHTENLFIRGKIKELASRDKELKTSEYTDFFLDMMKANEKRFQSDLRKVSDSLKQQKAKNKSLWANVQNYRSSLSNLPKLLFNIVKERIKKNEMDRIKGKAATILPRSIRLSRGDSNRSDNKKDSDFDQEDINVEAILGYTEEEKQDLLTSILSNNVVMGALAELLYKNDVFDYKRSRSQYARPDVENKINKSSLSRSRHQKERFITSVNLQNQVNTERLDESSEAIEQEQIDPTVTEKRQKVLRFLLRTKQGYGPVKGRLFKGPNFSFHSNK